MRVSKAVLVLVFLGVARVDARDEIEFPGNGLCTNRWAANIRATTEQRDVLNRAFPLSSPPRVWDGVELTLTEEQRRRYLELCPQIREAPKVIRVFSVRAHEACESATVGVMIKPGWIRMMSTCKHSNAAASDGGRPNAIPF